MKLKYDGTVRKVFVGHDYFEEQRAFEDTDTVVMYFGYHMQDAVSNCDNLLYKAFNKISVDNIVHCACFEPLLFNLELFGEYPCVVVLMGKTHNEITKDINDTISLRKALVEHEEVMYIHEPTFKPMETAHLEVKPKCYNIDEVAFVVPTTDIDNCSNIKIPNNILKLIAVKNGKTSGPRDSEFVENKTTKTIYMKYPYDFNYSMINNDAVAYVRQFKPKVKYLVLCNDDVVLRNDTTAHLLNPLIVDEKIGIAGAKLLYEDNTVQHFGVGYSKNKLPYHVRRHALTNDIDVSSYQCTYDVTFALVAVRACLFKTVRFDERLPYDFNDIDFCLRARSAGWKIICNPLAVATHFESRTRKNDTRQDSRVEMGIFLNKHGSNIR